MDDRKPKPKPKEPSLATLERWSNSGSARATDGCKVEPDGYCPHGCPSWLLELEMI
jgi:hypothetical protein